MIRGAVLYTARICRDRIRRFIDAPGKPIPSVSLSMSDLLIPSVAALVAVVGEAVVRNDSPGNRR